VAPVLFRARADLRSRWRAWVGLAVLVGLFAGAITAVVAGARRTDSAFPRFLKATKAPDILVFSLPGEQQGFAQFSAAELRGIPQVSQVGTAAAFSVVNPAAINLVAPTDDAIGGRFFKRKLLHGRLPRPDRPDEVNVGFLVPQKEHVGVGDRLRVRMATATPSRPPESTRSSGGPPALRQGDEQVLRTFTFRIVGVVAGPTEFPPQQGTGVEQVWATPAFYRAHADELVNFGVTALGLRHGAGDVRAAQAAISRLAAGRPAHVFPLADQTVNTEHSIHLQAIALWMLAGLLGVAVFLVLVQLLVRQSALEAGEHPDLRALGMSRSQLWAVAMARAGLVGFVGAVLGTVVALSLSPLLPIGLARVAEPHPGLAFDATALGLGALGTVVLVLACASAPAWRAARVAARQAGLSSPAGQQAPSRVAEALGRAAAPAAITTGVRLALEPGRGRTAVPVRSTIAGAVVGVAALATALAFTASLGHLLATPRLYGVSWDAEVSTVVAEDVESALPRLASDPRVQSLSVGYVGFPLAMAHTRADGMAMKAEKGSPLLPTPLAGRLPKAADEIMLGSSTMSAVHARIGSTVRASIADTGRTVMFKVVGRGVFPSLSDASGLGKGAATTIAGLERSLGPGVDAPPMDTALVRFRPGVDKAHAIAELNRDLTADGDALFKPGKPVDLLNFGRVQNLPIVLAGLLGAVAVATLTHLLITSIRRRRRDLAILKTLGFLPAQVRHTVAWQATTLAAVAAVIGIPVGVAAGRWIWIVFAHKLGIVARPAVSGAPIIVLAVATLAVANLVAVVPANVAARLRPAIVLRSE
jgi:putative ABC transport system permease protein